MSPIRVEELPAQAPPEWDAYVDAHAGGTFFHRAGWRAVLATGFGLRSRYLWARAGTRTVGILPLARVRSLFGGDALISTPFCVRGGILADSAEIAAALLDAATAYARAAGVDHLELRGGAPCGDPIMQSNYCTFERAITADLDANLRAIPRKQRAMIRKGEAAGITVRVDAGTETFYRLYAQSVHRHGTPVYPRRYIDALVASFGAACEILTATCAGAPVASVLSFYHADRVLPYYAGASAAGRGLRAYDVLYWHLLARAAARGARVFDFGRSAPDTGGYHYKRHWGFEPRPLGAQFHLIRGTRVPRIDPTNPRYRWLTATWRRLPLALANFIGPRLALNLA